MTRLIPGGRRRRHRSADCLPRLEPSPVQRPRPQHLPPRRDPVPVGRRLRDPRGAANAGSTRAPNPVACFLPQSPSSRRSAALRLRLLGSPVGSLRWFTSDRGSSSQRAGPGAGGRSRPWRGRRPAARRCRSAAAPPGAVLPSRGGPARGNDGSRGSRWAARTPGWSAGPGRLPADGRREDPGAFDPARGAVRAWARVAMACGSSEVSSRSGTWAAMGAPPWGYTLFETQITCRMNHLVALTANKDWNSLKPDFRP
jgi:hypothetical protein